MTATITQTETRRCECSLWIYQIPNPDDTEGSLEVETQCYIALTGGKSRFAQGHDAKLKSLLIAAGLEDTQVGKIGTGTTTWMSPVSAASLFGFSRQVAEGIARGQKRAAIKAGRKAARTGRGDVKAEVAKVHAADAVLKEAGPTEVKVGRWWYPIVTVWVDGKITYKTKKGGQDDAPAGAEVR